MPGGSYRQADVGCPFYKSDDCKQKLICEGPVAGSSLTLFFRQKADWLNQIQGYCCRFWKYCPVYRAVMEKYEK